MSRHIISTVEQPIESVIAGSDLRVVPAVEESFGKTLIEGKLLATPLEAARFGIARHVDAISALYRESLA